MRAAVCREFAAPLSVEDVQIATPGSSEVLVDISACAICHSDIAYIDGAWRGQIPAIFGHEASGLVSAVGEGVSSVKPGDAVAVTLVRSCGSCFYCSRDRPHLCDATFRLDKEPPLHDAAGDEIWHGLRTAAFAEQALVHESQVSPVPANMPKSVAALLACSVVTGFGAVANTADVPAGSSVVVVGTGGVGLNSIQGAVHAGASQVVAVDLRDDKLEAARKLGATATINSASDDANVAVAALTEGRGADYVFVTVGSSRAIEQALPLLRRAGTLVIVGLPPTGDLIQFDPTEFAVQGHRILGSKMGSVRVKRDIPTLAGLYAAGQLELDQLITGTYSLDEINDAIASTRSGEAVRNVIVFD